MKLLPKLLFFFSCITFTGFTVTPDQDAEAELICMRTQKSSNTCFYNFKMGGIPYHFKDVGCKRKKDEVVKAVNAGELALMKDWKIVCPEEKKKEEPKAEKTDF